MKNKNNPITIYRFLIVIIIIKYYLLFNCLKNDHRVPGFLRRYPLGHQKQYPFQRVGEGILYLADG